MILTRFIPAVAALVLGLAGGFFLASARAKDEKLSPVSDVRLHELVRESCALAPPELSFALSVMERIYDEPATDGPDVRIKRETDGSCSFDFVVGEDSFWQGKGVVRRDSAGRLRVLLFSKFDRSLKDEGRPSAAINIVFDGERTYFSDTRSGRIWVGTRREVGALKAIGN